MHAHKQFLWQRLAVLAMHGPAVPLSSMKPWIIYGPQIENFFIFYFIQLKEFLEYF